MVPSRPVFLACLLLLTAAGPARSQFASVDLAATSCGQRESRFRAGFEAAETDGTRASGGSGGAVGAISLSIHEPDSGRTDSFLLHVPAGYDEQFAWPLVVALHGTAGSAAAAPAYAEAVRTLWQPLADREGVLVLAPVGSGSQGGWAPGVDTPALACALATVERQWNVDRSRRHLWGFSSGGHYGHALALGNPWRFAAYAVNAGVLYGFACSQPGTTYDCATTLPQVARRIPASLRVGILDTQLRPYALGDVDRMVAAGWSMDADLTYSEFYGGHTAGSGDVEVAWAWFVPHPLPP